ncbi:hypothetical protein BT69DRAFT_1275974 [Atractiella rhizophila]|nr:hypothetical protein BT69DRAFT_1275974 [Atractiella rhizophila]
MILIHSSVHARVGSFQVWFERDDSNNLTLHLRNGGNKFDSGVVTDLVRIKDLPRSGVWTARDDEILQEMIDEIDEIDEQRGRAVPSLFRRTYDGSTVFPALTLTGKGDVSGKFAFYHKALGDVIWMSGATRWMDDSDSEDDEDVDLVRNECRGGELLRTKTWVEDQISMIQQREIERAPTPTSVDA